MTTTNNISQMENITNQMAALEIEINRQQAYIMKHGDSNDAGEQDDQWDEYKSDAARNLDKWDQLKSLRDNIKTSL